ncbi:MAG: protein-L-isoaspartate O-methyltransferase [Sphingomonadales bacterium]|nr:protein-L-isoaspartate O-methyltransferase [Sphingomonadales bacterium]
MNDFATQRINMVDSQVRPSDVTDRRILRAMLALPRETFVPGQVKATAYMDEHLALGQGRYLLAPRTFAKLVQLLAIGEDDAVLDVACATGYSTAVLATLARSVVGLEGNAGLAQQAQTALAGLGRTNTMVKTGELTAGAPGEGPFDAILINGCVVDVPDALLDQLKDGGRLAAVRCDGPVGQATLWRRHGTSFDARPAFDAGAPLLPGFEKQPGFVF